MSGKYSRREILKLMGLTMGGALIPHQAWTAQEPVYPLIIPENGFSPTSRVITAITLGAGSRGNVYGDYALNFPEQLKIVGVAEPIPIRMSVIPESII